MICFPDGKYAIDVYELVYGLVHVHSLFSTEKNDNNSRIFFYASKLKREALSFYDY